VEIIDAMSDGDLSEGFQGMSTLLECAPVISALEHRGLSWTTLSKLDCICNLDASSSSSSDDEMNGNLDLFNSSSSDDEMSDSYSVPGEW